MPVCAACHATRGFNKCALEAPPFSQRAAYPVCKECLRAGKCAAVPAVGPESLDPTDLTRKHTRLQDFKLLAVIGQGAFGKVLLVRHGGTNQVHAMKIISKKFLHERDSVRYMRAERDIMTKLYLVMDFQPGGELFSYLRQEGTFSEDKARFYLAEMILALEHLHSKGIIHRDLKPENVLISAEGHVKLTDFGLAKECGEGAHLNTVCGTKEYMAPEMLLGKGYDAAVDWWSLGALAFEMLVGEPPFRGRSDRDTPQKILTAKLQLPKWLSADAHSLLKALLERNVSKRLGCGKSTMFAKLDWNAVEKCQVVPPMVPVVQHEADTSHFDAKFTKLPAADLHCDDVVPEDVENLFAGFSFYGLESLEALDIY
ncbi:hypothetical protein P43SY_003111 [Pythium insidiosum]|uniref:AGC protein kinase n=1 Tax=Pythium insidiosum TaxID=114742 RepID=A0AAD5QEG2_PYTIN|nr:hypothetical protein P43SY_003111 [Pythium insidiosum]